MAARFIMATKTVVCPECGEAAAPGRYACADCGALLAAVGTFARRWEESETLPEPEPAVVAASPSAFVPAPAAAAASELVAAPVEATAPPPVEPIAAAAPDAVAVA